MKHYLGIDLGGTKVRVGEVDKEGKIYDIYSASSFALESKEIIINNIFELINKFNLDNIEGIGIGVPGPVNQKKGSMELATNIPALENIELVNIIKEKTNKDVYMENDANVAGLAEAIYGAGKDKDIVYYITHSTGIGGGLIINGRIISGHHGFAGEVANIIVKDSKDKINHLYPGAVENEASGTSLARKAKIRIDENIENAAQVFDLVRKENLAAIKLIDEMSKDLAIMLNNICCCVSPDCFVIGGGCTNSSDLYFDKVRNYFKEIVHKQNSDIEIKKAILDEPGLLGAALLAIKK